MKHLLLRSWNWCRRFRYRCGYGVHSPSDFFLITYIIYEKLPYYAYAALHKARADFEGQPHYREKVDKLLFRLANYFQPSILVDTGNELSARYMATACPKMKRWTLQNAVAGGISPDMVHIADITGYKEAFELLLPLANRHTCFIIGLPYATKEKQAWWKEVVSDPRTGVTFDLYDIGLVFFDKNRVKEHRIVNFL